MISLLDIKKQDLKGANSTMLKLYSRDMDITLEIPSIDDADQITEQANSEDIARSVGSVGEFPYPYTIEDSRSAINSAMEGYSFGVAYNFAVRIRNGSEVIGMAGLRNVNMHSKSAEMGFWTGQAYRGRGYTKAALKMLLYFSFDILKLNRVYATAISGNDSSIALMKSLGMKEEGILRNAAVTAEGLKNQVMLSILSGEYKNDIDIVATQ